MEQIPKLDQSMATMVDAIHDIATGVLPQGKMLGIVRNPPPDMVVECNNIKITKEQIYCDNYWLVGHDRTAKGHIVSETQPRSGGSGYAEFASHTHPIHNDYTDTIIMTDTYEAGDIVTVEPIYGQTEQLYFIGQKVTKL